MAVPDRTFTVGAGQSKTGAIQIDGMAELVAGVRKAVDRDLPKALGGANRLIGELVISKLTPAPDPAAVGEGQGAAVRPSSTMREVVLRAGGAHRNKGAPRQPWGVRRVKRTGARVKRPNIQATARAHAEEIQATYLAAVMAAMAPAFAETETQ